jgi:voltage-gated sodium channel
MGKLQSPIAFEGETSPAPKDDEALEENKLKESKLDKFCKYVYTPSVSIFVLITIIVNSIILGLETSKSIREDFGTVLKLIDQICIFIFCIELFMKMVCEKFKFFCAGWNIFDFFIVGISLIPGASYFSVLRSFRIIRAMSLIAKLPKVRVIAESIIHSLPSIGWLSLLLAILFYIFAVLATTLFGLRFPEWFGDIGTSMFTNFQLLTLDSWSSGIARPIMNDYPYAYLLFIPFVLISSFVVLNVFIGVIVNSVQVVTEKNENKYLEQNGETNDEDEFIQTRAFSDEEEKKRVQNVPDHLKVLSSELGSLRDQLNRIENMLKTQKN